MSSEGQGTLTVATVRRQRFQRQEMVRRVLWLEVLLFALLPAFAAAMARGYGEWR